MAMTMRRSCNSSGSGVFRQSFQHSQHRQRRCRHTNTRGKTRSFGALIARASAESTEFDYDLVIIGCGVGGHGAALHAVRK